VIHNSTTSSRHFDPSPPDGLDVSSPARESAGAPSLATHQARPHILTVVLEDYYHVSPFKKLIDASHWSRFERRLEIGTERTLDLLDEFGIRATFFVLGWVADAAPELVRRVAERGHEIASKGYSHRGLRELGAAFPEDLARAREALERAAGRRVIGYRAAEGWLPPSELGMLDVLVREGYLYDSSLKPSWRAYAAEPWRRAVHQHISLSGTLWEFPISSVRLLGVDVPVGGGNHFRQFPRAFVQRAIDHWVRKVAAPLVLYFHTWELDPDQPRISLAPTLARVRQYRNLARMEAMLRHCFRQLSFGSIASHLGAPLESVACAAVTVAPPVAVPTGELAPAGAQVEPVTVVVPCFNEESSLPYLANTLAQVREELAARYALRFVFVDDGSTDGTLPALQRLFGGWPGSVVVPHGANRGITAAILTGIRAATTDIVCSIDCDCTYDPRRLADMIPLLADRVDLVTASPYHPLGAVKNVQGWRLALSRSASRLYRVVLRQKLHTYTSCFRVYRRSSVLALDVRDPGYLGLVELIGKLDLAGGTIVECPAVLEARLLGRSKMKVVKNVFRHLGQLVRLAWLRVRPPESADSARPFQRATPSPVARARRGPETL
jgi:polysaccharide deacetylase family protein (PEP-CTERM system associated)